MNMLNEIANELMTHPQRTVFVAFAVIAFTTALYLTGGDPPVYTAPPIFACYCVGLYLRRK